MAREERQRKDYEEQIAKLVAEKNELFLQLQNEKAKLAASEEQVSKLTGQKNDLEKQVSVSWVFLTNHGRPRLLSKPRSLTLSL